MDMSGLLGVLTGGGGVKIDILLDTSGSQGVVPMDHFPSWKLHKNPFWRVKHPRGSNVHPMGSSIAPTTTTPGGYGSSLEFRQEIAAYEASHDVKGIVQISLPAGKKVEHLGIKVQFIGRIDMGQGAHEGRPHYDFISLSKELYPPGVLYQSLTEFPFLFNMEKEHESYKGKNVAVRYFVNVLMERKYMAPVQKQKDVWVQILGTEPTKNEAIKMEVGIEDCLHIEFEYDRRVFHLEDTIIGKIHFMLVRIKIKHMELAVIRRETSGEGLAASAQSAERTPQSAVDVNNIFTETQTLIKYEIMSGAPVKGEVIPVRLSLRGLPCDLTPTYTAVNNRFSVRYFLNLVLVDEEDRRYFKQQEIFLWRRTLG